MKEKTNLIVFVGLIAVIFILATGTGSDSMKDTVSVSGTGTLTVEPDEAEVYLSVVTEGEEADQVQKENSNKIADIMDELEGLGISEDNIETDYYYLYPKTSWDYDDSGRSEIYGYRLTHTLKVTTKDIENTGKIVDAAVDAGANDVDRVKFKLSEELMESSYEDALEEASKSAKSKAESITGALGVKLGKVERVAESSAYSAAYKYLTSGLDYSMAEQAAPTQISPEDVEVNAYVSVVYKI